MAALSERGVSSEGNDTAHFIFLSCPFLSAKTNVVRNILRVNNPKPMFKAAFNSLDGCVEPLI